VHHGRRLLQAQAVLVQQDAHPLRAQADAGLLGQVSSQEGAGPGLAGGERDRQRLRTRDYVGICTRLLANSCSILFASSYLLLSMFLAAAVTLKARGWGRATDDGSPEVALSPAALSSPTMSRQSVASGPVPGPL
jgi:hypothetical protein